MKKKSETKLENWKWPMIRRADGRIEYQCPHGVGHGWIHGCDGCCSHTSFPKAKKENTR